jgi:hypothetical protein
MMPNHILERLFGVGQCPTCTMRLGEMAIAELWWSSQFIYTHTCK